MATLDDIDAFFDALVDGGNDDDETGGAGGGGGGEENEDGSSVALLHPSGGSPSSCLLGESSALNLDRLRSPDFSLSPGGNSSSFLPPTPSLLGVEKDASLHPAPPVGPGNLHPLRHTALPPSVSISGVSTANRLHSQPSSSSLPPVSVSAGGFEAGRVVSGGEDHHSSSIDGRGKHIFPSEGIPQRQGHTPGDGVRTLERGLPGGVYTPGSSSQGKGDVGGVLGEEHHEAQRGRYVLGGSAGAQDMRQGETATKGMAGSSLPTSTVFSGGSLHQGITSSAGFGVKSRQGGSEQQQRGQSFASSSSYSTRVLSESTAKGLPTSSSAHSLISPSPRLGPTSPRPAGDPTQHGVSLPGDGVQTARVPEAPPPVASSSFTQGVSTPHGFVPFQHQGNDASLSSSIPPSFSSASATGHPASSSSAGHPLSSASPSLPSDSSSLSLDPRKAYSQPPVSLPYGEDGHDVGRSFSSSTPSGLSMPHPSSSVGSSFPPYPPFAMHLHSSLHPAAPSSHFLSRHPRLIVPLSKELAEEEGGVLGGEKKRGFLVNLGQDGSGPPEFTVSPSLLVPSLPSGSRGQGGGGAERGEEQDRGGGERDITLQQSMAFCSQTVSRLIQAKLLENDQMLYAVHENLSVRCCLLGREISCFSSLSLDYTTAGISKVTSRVSLVSPTICVYLSIYVSIRASEGCICVRSHVGRGSLNVFVPRGELDREEGERRRQWEEG